MSLSKPVAANRRKIKSSNLFGSDKGGTRTAPRGGRRGKSSGLPVLLGEEPEAYRDRLMAWTGDLGPRNQVELYLVERAVKLSWELDCADRALSVCSGEATGRLSGAASGDGTIRADRGAFEDSDRVERLRRHQRSCGRLLLRTLDVIAGLRESGAARGSDPGVSSLRLADDRPRAMTTDRVRPGDPSLGQAAATDRVAPAGSPSPTEPAAAGSAAGSSIAEAATLMDALAATSPIEGPPPGRTRRECDTPTALPDRCDEPREAANPGDAPRRTRPSSRLGIPRRRAHQPDWPASRRPGTGDSALDPKATPDRRGAETPEASASRAEARRRVGGYAVPLDPTIPVSCADRIPVRLRRQATGARACAVGSSPTA
jgi:hypothetical protein